MLPASLVFCSTITPSFFARSLYTFGKPRDVDFLPLQIPHYFLKISLEHKRFVLLWVSAAILIKILSWRRTEGRLLPRRFPETENGEGSVAHWCEPCRAGLGAVLEGSAGLVGQWLLLWEWGIALHLLPEGSVCVFSSSSITAPDFTRFSL